MDDNSVDPRLLEMLKKLQDKYIVMGQDLSSYLEGLLHADYLTYWDYIHLDTLLSLQTPKTQIPDEKVFITYHQITELYFKLILWELEQIAFRVNLDEKYFIDRLKRLNRYFRQLISSFDIMIDGLDKEQFQKFRMALLPASGFQSGQFRLIEFCSTPLIHLVSEEYRESFRNSNDMAAMMEKLYWRFGATELASGQKTLTLQQFETKYMETFFETCSRFKGKTLADIYESKFLQSPGKQMIVGLLRDFDLLVNMEWRLIHLKSAGKHLAKDISELEATGGTNWQRYLPPRFQRIMFFPNLWSDQEKLEWGKSAVMRALAQA